MSRCVWSPGSWAAHFARVAAVVMACSLFGGMFTAARLGALADRFGSWRVTGVHVEPHAVFLVTGALVAACGGLVRWAQRRVRA